MKSEFRFQGMTCLFFVTCFVVGFCGFFESLSANDQPAAENPIRQIFTAGFAEIALFDLNKVSVDEAQSALPPPLWSWKASGREELPVVRQKQFGTTDEIKLVDGGKQLLVTSSGGGCALIQRVATPQVPTGTVLWSATVANAHSIEPLPSNRVVVAASTAKAGNKLVVFDLAKGDEPLAETPLYSAHGVVWDHQRQRLYAVGFRELNCYELTTDGDGKCSLRLDETNPLPDEGGHDLQPVPDSRDLSITTHDHVYLFDRNTKSFRKHPVLGDYQHMKCVSFRREGQQLETLFVQASDEHWWSHSMGLFTQPVSITMTEAGQESIRIEAQPPVGITQIPLGKLGVYKVRWLGK
ncbi:hypothetical protein Plim_3299 [Planctopirus limnophila DSM 3776]|uniref:Uncharacterized protein n=1 Tax=Planctopirus limnophila (strain ATCC 43296 / DSM 3776 / IFAM 1008 / Mu 290) TaxID=521674 RepID=D5SU59_PLAL2|nr:DUF6528 family protein [Planctopirus limnophila]ADG69112.1 hypothetical protein Plim_3299 [Planctopirus limnophila DSM 3776]